MKYFLKRITVSGPSSSKSSSRFLSRLICVSESLQSSIRVSPDTNLARHSSPSFWSQRLCSAFSQQGEFDQKLWDCALRIVPRAEQKTAFEAFSALQTVIAVNYGGNAHERHARKAAQSFLIRYNRYTHNQGLVPRRNFKNTSFYHDAVLLTCFQYSLPVLAIGLGVIFRLMRSLPCIE